jgi:hypothetical protein
MLGEANAVRATTRPSLTRGVKGKMSLRRHGSLPVAASSAIVAPCVDFLPWKAARVPTNTFPPATVGQTTYTPSSFPKGVCQTRAPG